MEATDILKEVSSEERENTTDSGILVGLESLVLHEVRELAANAKLLHDIRACVADSKARAEAGDTPVSEDVDRALTAVVDALTELIECRGEQIKTSVDVLVAYGQAPSEGLADKVREMGLSVKSYGEHTVSLLDKAMKSLSNLRSVVGSTLDYVPDEKDSAEEQDNVSGNGEDS